MTSGTRPQRSCASWHRSGKTASVQRINRDIRFVAGVNGCGEFGLALNGQRKSGRKKNKYLAARNAAQIFSEGANRQKHGASAEVAFRVRKSRETGYRDRR